MDFQSQLAPLASSHWPVLLCLCNTTAPGMSILVVSSCQALRFDPLTMSPPLFPHLVITYAWCVMNETMRGNR